MTARAHGSVRRRLLRVVGGAVLVVGSAGCAGRAATKAPVAVLVVGDAAGVGRTRAALSGAPIEAVELRFVEAPRAGLSEGPTGAVESALGAARAAYVEADSPRCLSALGDDTQIASLLQEGRRGVAGRVLFWRVACRVVAGEREEAEREAGFLAGLGLEAPDEAGAASPEVEAIIGEALSEAAARPGAALRVAANVPVEVAVDGRAAACSTPCSVDLRPGAHFVTVSGDGVTPVTRRVTVPVDREVTFAVSPATPDLAARQWVARYAGAPLVESNASVTLLARSAAARNFVLFVLDSTPSPPRLRGALAVDGAVPARAERAFLPAAGPTEVAPALLRELLVGGRVLESRPLYESPWFWASIAAAAAIAAGVTYGVLYEPPTRTEVRF